MLPEHGREVGEQSLPVDRFGPGRHFLEPERGALPLLTIRLGASALNLVVQRPDANAKLFGLGLSGAVIVWRRQPREALELLVGIRARDLPWLFLPIGEGAFDRVLDALKAVIFYESAPLGSLGQAGHDGGKVDPGAF